MITLTQEEQAQLNLHYQGFTIDETKGPHELTETKDAGCHTELLKATGRLAHLYYDFKADHVYVYQVDVA